MKVLLLGSNGMLGQAIYRELNKIQMQVFGVDRRDADYNFDLLNDERLKKCISEIKPDIVINTAAIVNMEMCEGNPGGAYCLNSRLPGVLSDYCASEGSYFIHISTDHFYCGDGIKRHHENEKITLMNEYARTKYIGECLALSYDNTLVIRTNIVGFRGRGHLTFLEWVLSEIQHGNEMRLFTDFYTSSIHTLDFAKILSEIILKHPVGIYNLASCDVKNKKEFILGLSNAVLGYVPAYKDMSVHNLAGVPRADSLGLDTRKIEKLLGHAMPGFQDTLNSIKSEWERRRKLNELRFVNYN